MNIAELSIKYRIAVIVLILIMLGAGIYSYFKLPRLEDPEFTIKQALIITAYPGASAREVEEEISDEIEKAVQQLGQLKLVESKSTRGLSIVTAEIKDKYNKYMLPQVWDELRRKVADAQQNLPPGTKSSIVVDDYSDVYGVFYAITGDGYNYSELKEFAKFLQRELLLVDDVKKIELFGLRDEAVYIETLRSKVAAIGIAPELIVRALSRKNLVSDAGRVKVGSEYIPIEPTGTITSLEQLGNILLARDSKRLVFLKDVAHIYRGYIDPPESLIFHNGKPAVGIAISTVFGGNVVRMGEAIKKRLKELKPEIPAGIELNVIALQSETVTKAVNGFAINLLAAVLIVIGVLLVFMGMRSGLLIGFVLFLTICSTFWVMGMLKITLERISLGALIIALGMLVDNAIVITEGMLVKIKRGSDKVVAAGEVVSKTMLPLLGATAISIIAFAAIGLSKDNTGEYCRSLFIVLLISLALSWITAITATPVLGYYLLNHGKKTADGAIRDPYDGRFFHLYRGFLKGCLKLRWLAIGIIAILLGLGITGFFFVRHSFFPNSTRPQFYIDFWLPEGTHITDTAKLVREAEKYLHKKPEIKATTTFIGSGSSRFLLVYTPEKPNSSYAMLLATVDDWEKMDKTIEQAQNYFDRNFPQAMINVKKFLLGPGEGGRIQARFSGPDSEVLRRLAEQTMDIMHKNPSAKGIRSDWREKVKTLQPVFSEAQARRSGITNQDVANMLQEGFAGITIGIFREKDEILPIVARANRAIREDVRNIEDLTIWSPGAQKMIPLRQVVPAFKTIWENPIIMRRNRRPTITVHCGPRAGITSTLFNQLKPEIEHIPLPEGYSLEWGGEYEDSRNAQLALASSVPGFAIMMVLIVIFLFNSLRHPLIIFLCLPLSIIGVTAGLLLFDQPFGFMALLGLLSLSGMLIKNAIVLIDEINLEIKQGKEPLKAILDSSVNRLRPVSMATVTTVLGMLPLLTDAFFITMAVTIMFGLSFACLLTLIVVPIFYATFFRIKYNPKA